MGSGLFCFKRTKGVKHKLDDAVVLEGRQCNQLAGGSDDDPRRWMMNEVHGKHVLLHDCSPRNGLPVLSPVVQQN